MILAEGKVRDRDQVADPVFTVSLNRGKDHRLPTLVSADPINA